MQQPGACGRRSLGNRSNRRIVDRTCQRRLILRAIHCRIGGGIDHPVGLDVRQCFLDSPLVGNVELPMCSNDDFVPAGACLVDRAGDLAATQHQHSHGNFSISANDVPFASFEESFG